MVPIIKLKKEKSKRKESLNKTVKPNLNIDIL